MQIPHFSVQQAGKSNPRGGYYVRGGLTAYKTLEVWFPTEGLAEAYAAHLNMGFKAIEEESEKALCVCGQPWPDHVGEGFGSVKCPCRHFKLAKRIPLMRVK